MLSLRDKLLNLAAELRERLDTAYPDVSKLYDDEVLYRQAVDVFDSNRDGRASQTEIIGVLGKGSVLSPGLRFADSSKAWALRDAQLLATRTDFWGTLLGESDDRHQSEYLYELLRPQTVFNSPRAVPWSPDDVTSPDTDWSNLAQTAHDSGRLLDLMMDVNAQRQDEGSITSHRRAANMIEWDFSVLQKYLDDNVEKSPGAFLTNNRLHTQIDANFSDWNSAHKGGFSAFAKSVRDNDAKGWRALKTCLVLSRFTLDYLPGFSGQGGYPKLDCNSFVLLAAHLLKMNGIDSQAVCLPARPAHCFLVVTTQEGRFVLDYNSSGTGILKIAPYEAYAAVMTQTGSGLMPPEKLLDTFLSDISTGLKEPMERSRADLREAKGKVAYLESSLSQERARLDALQAESVSLDEELKKEVVQTKKQFGIMSWVQLSHDDRKKFKLCMEAGYKAMESGAYDEAVRELGVAYKIFQNNTGVNSMFAEALAKSGVNNKNLSQLILAYQLDAGNRAALLSFKYILQIEKVELENNIKTSQQDLATYQGNIKYYAEQLSSLAARRLVVMEQAYALNPDNPLVCYNFAVCRMRMSEVYAELGDTQQAAQLEASSTALFDEIAKRWPGMVEI